MYPKQRMLLWSSHSFKIRPPLRIARSEFLHQMTPLMLKLATRHIDLA